MKKTLFSLSFLISLSFAAKNLADSTREEEERRVYRFNYAEFRAQTQLLAQDSGLELFSDDSTEPLPNLHEIPATITSSSGKLVTANVHKQITEAALRGLVSDTCLKEITESNNLQDEGAPFLDVRNHFDDNQICESFSLLQEREERLVHTAQSREAARLLGQILHAVQDFYSHANYLELWLEQSGIEWQNIKLADFNTLCTGITRNSPTRDQAFLTRLFTSYYHGHGAKNLFDKLFFDLPDPKSHLHWNKDFPPIHDFWLAFFISRASFKKPDLSKKDTYFDIAFDLQVRHSKAIFTRFQSAFAGQTCL